MSALVWYACVWTLLVTADARRYERCELAHDLLRYGVERDQLATWVCIAYHESRYDTAAVNPHSGDYGILQISELFWCGSGGANVCGVPCSDFVDDQIADDVRCALRIYREHTTLQGDGFLAWVAYSSCREHHVKKYLVDCDDLSKNVTSAAKLSTASPTTLSVAFNATYYRNIDELRPPKFDYRPSTTNASKSTISREPKMLRISGVSATLKFNIDELRLPVFNYNISRTIITPSSTRPTVSTPSTTQSTTRTPHSSTVKSTFSTNNTSRTTPETTSRPTSTFKPTTARSPYPTRNSSFTASSTARSPYPARNASFTVSSTARSPYPARNASFTASSRITSTTSERSVLASNVTVAPKLEDSGKISHLSSPTPTKRTSDPTTSTSSTTSIFDLYLNTRRPSPSTYSFKPFSGKRYQIFSGGSTTPYTPLFGKYVDLDLLKHSSDGEATPKHNRYIAGHDEIGYEI